jgi:PncC family amidohydrolase
LQDAVVGLLREQNRTLATTEWGTAGLVTHWLGGVAGAEGYYLGGVVASGKEALGGVLGVEAGLLERHSPDSGEVARAMALGCRERFASDYGLAVARFPEFDPEADEPKPAFFALATPGGVQLEKFPFAGHPATLKIFCAKRALNMARLALLEAS